MLHAAREKWRSKCASAESEAADNMVVTHRIEFAKGVTLREFNVPDLSDATMISCFPSPACLVPTLVAGYISDGERLKDVRVVATLSTRDTTRAVIDRKIPMHPIRVLASGKTVLLMSEFPLEKIETIWSVAEALMDFCVRHRIATIVCCEGAPQTGADPEQDGTLKYVATGYVRDAMERAQHDCIDSGVISGITGCFLADAPHVDGLEVGVLVAPTDAQLRYRDTFAAHNVLMCLLELLDIDIDLKPLLDKAKLIEGKAGDLLSGGDDKESLLSTRHMYL